MSARVLKWNVPVDDHPHKIGTGRVLHVGCQHGPESVQVWTLESDQPSQWKPVQVFGTGQPVPAQWAHIGTAVFLRSTPFGVVSELVWHVFEAPPGQWAADQPASGGPA